VAQLATYLTKFSFCSLVIRTSGEPLAGLKYSFVENEASFVDNSARDLE